MLPDILSGQKLIKNAKNGPCWGVLKTFDLWSNSVTTLANFSRIIINIKQM